MEATKRIHIKSRLIPKLRFNEFDGEWNRAKLGDVSQFINGKAYKQEELLEKGKYPVLRVGNFFSNNSWYYSDLELEENKYCDEGDLLYAWSASFGPKIWEGGKAIYHYHIWKVVNRERIEKKFLFQILDNETIKLKTRSSNGFALLHITKGFIENWEVNFPSVPEQQKIASFLSAIDEKIQQLTRKKALLEQYKKGVMQQLFSGKIRFKDENGKAYPKWEEKRLGELGDFRGGGTPNTKIEKYWNGNIPWISSSDINENDIHNINITRYINAEAIKESATKLIPKGSIMLISRVGVGKLAISKVELCTSQDFTNFIPKDCNSYFLGYLLTAQKNLLVSLSQGTSIKGFTTEDLKSLRILIPILAEQQKIANYLSVIDTKIETVATQIAKTQEFKKGLLQKMFV